MEGESRTLINLNRLINNYERKKWAYTRNNFIVVLLNVMLFFLARNNPTKIARISLKVMNEKLAVSSA